MTIKGYFSKLSISAKIKVFNLTIGLAFLLFLAVMIISLSHARTVFVKNVADNIETLVNNSHVGRNLAVLFSDSNLLFNTFYGREDYLLTEGRLLLEQAKHISQHSIDPELGESIRNIENHLQSSLALGAELNDILQKKNTIESTIFKKLDSLDEIIAEQTINQFFTGKDTSFLEHLSVQIIDYRHSLLEIGKYFAELSSSNIMTEKKQVNFLYTKIDNLLLSLRIITASDQQTYQQGKHLHLSMEEYKNIIHAYCAALASLSVEANAFNEEKTKSIELLQNTDANIVSTTTITNRNIRKFLLGTGAALFLIALLGLAFVLLATSYFQRSTINVPMAMLKKTLTSFSKGDLTAKIKMNRSDEWGLIGRLLNKMADDLLASHRDLQKSEEKYREIFNTPSEAIFIHDAKTGEILDVNQATLDIFGYPFKEALQQNIETLSSGEPPYTLMTATQYIENAKEQGPQLFDWRSKRKNGELFWSEVGLKYKKFSEHHYVVAVVRDITERKHAEQLLAAEREQLAVTLRSIGDGVITTDNDGAIIFLNKVAEQLTGWTNEGAKGKPAADIFNIINEKTGIPCKNPIQKVLELGKIIGLANHTALIARDGTVRSIADSGAPIRDSESKVIGVVLVFRDVTNEQKIKEELLKVRKLESIGVLAAGIAHDFNNILSAILGNIDLASRLMDKEDKAYSLLAEAQKATSRAVKLTQQLLTFAKGGDPIKENATLPQLIRDAADFVLHGSHISCNYSCPDDLWSVSVDVGQIGQVIQNIIINARHAMPEGGQIDIQCANVEDAATETLMSIHKGKFVRITIQDRGIGIPMEIIDKIFDPYFTSKQKGNGLGLAICHSIIKKHNGNITVQSQPGKGSKFNIYLPASDHSTIESTGRQKPIQQLAAPKSIMIMDDEEMLRIIAEAQLRQLGHKAILVADGSEAVSRYQELQEIGTPVDLIFMDLTIPGGMGGKEAVQKILQLDPDAKVIVSSGYSNDPVMANYREYGFVAALAKPFDLTELNHILTSVL